MPFLKNLGLSPSLTIGQRLMILVCLFVLTLGGILAYTISTIKALEFDAVVVDVAGRQRMLIQRYLNEVFLTSESNSRDFVTTQNTLNQSIEALLHGGPTFINLYSQESRVLPPAPTPQIVQSLQNQKTLLSTFFEKGNQFLTQTHQDPQRPKDMVSLMDLSLQLQKVADDGVKLFSAHSQEKTGSLLKWEPILALLFVFLSIIFARQVIAASSRLSEEIDQRKKAEGERNRFFSISQDLFCIAGFDGYFKSLNSSWTKILGYHMNELEAKLFLDFVHPDDIPSTQVEMQRLLKGQKTSQFENRYHCKDGTYKWLLWNATPDIDQQVIYATAHDVTNRKQNEQNLLLRDRSIESASNGILIVDAQAPDMPTVYCNSGFERITGYSKKEVIGQNCRFLQGLDNDQPGLDRLRTALQQAEECRVELRNYRKDGTFFWNELYVTPVRNNQGDVSHFIGVQTDITLRKQQVKELAEKTDELARSNQDLQQFAYVASHDLQEPLRMVSSYTQLLGKRYKGKLDADADEFIGFAVDGANRMQRLIRDLLEYSRVGAKDTSIETADCKKILQNVMDNLSSSIQENGAEIIIDPLPTIKVNSTMLSQLFQNLIGNALKFRSEQPLIIRVSAKREPAHWEFSVQDNGIGIPIDQQSRIFDIFQRLHSRTEYSGTGIGLAICKKIVERHGGRIWVESEPEGGSNFKFTLTVDQEFSGK